jgi:LAGLIDADG DNA endonuclease family
VIVGLLLSDANMQLNSPTANARLMFEQSFAPLRGAEGHFEYFWHVFIILSPYCLSYPRFRARLWHNSVNFSLTLVTIAPAPPGLFN